MSRHAPAELPRFDAEDLHVIWAAMCSMAYDIHAPQDQMTDIQWERARDLTERLTAWVNESRPAKKMARRG